VRVCEDPFGYSYFRSGVVPARGRGRRGATPRIFPYSHFEACFNDEGTLGAMHPLFDLLTSSGVVSAQRAGVKFSGGNGTPSPLPTS